MIVSPAALTLVESFEGLGDGNKKTVSLEPYIDPANIYTVGWGHALLTPGGQAIDIDVFGASKAKALAIDAMNRQFSKQALSRDECVTVLNKDVNIASSAVEKRIGPNNATQHEFDALSDFTFNVGGGNFATSSVKSLHVAGKREIGAISLHDLYDAAERKDSPTTMALAFVRWSNSQGKLNLGLFRRRVAELLVYSGWDAAKAVSTAFSFNP